MPLRAPFIRGGDFDLERDALPFYRYMEIHRPLSFGPATEIGSGAANRRTCYLHIGTHKTGSTAIQNALSEGAERLKQFGFLYPATGRTHEYTAHHNIAWDVGGANMFRREVGSAADLLKEIAACEHDVILSSEDFSNIVGSRQFKNFVVALQDNNFHVRIVVYLRNQIDYIRSLYLQGLHHQRTPPLDSFIARALAPIRLPELGITFLDYRDMLNRLRGIKDVDLIVRSYDDLKQTSVVRDFMSMLGLSGDEIGIDVDQRTNSQVPLDEAFSLFFQGQIGRAPDWGEQKIITAIFETLAERTIAISWPSQKKIIKKFSGSNEHVYERYGIPEFKLMKASRLTAEASTSFISMEDVFSSHLVRIIYDIAKMLTEDREGIINERDTAVHDRNMLAIAWNETRIENGQLAEERNALLRERDLLTKERDEAQRTRGDLAAENAKLTKSGEAMKAELDAMKKRMGWRLKMFLLGRRA